MFRSLVPMTRQSCRKQQNTEMRQNHNKIIEGTTASAVKLGTTRMALHRSQALQRRLLNCLNFPVL